MASCEELDYPRRVQLVQGTVRVLKHISVLQWHQLFFPFLLFFFFRGCPTKHGLPQEGLPFFSRVTEQLRYYVGQETTNSLERGLPEPKEHIKSNHLFRGFVIHPNTRDKKEAYEVKPPIWKLWHTPQYLGMGPILVQERTVYLVTGARHQSGETETTPLNLQTTN